MGYRSVGKGLKMWHQFCYSKLATSWIVTGTSFADGEMVVGNSWTLSGCYEVFKTVNAPEEEKL